MCSSFYYTEMKVIIMHENFMLEAIKEAEKAFAIDEVPIGCVIVYHNKIIARAHNLRESKQSAIAHAEILAIEKSMQYNRKLAFGGLYSLCYFRAMSYV